MRSALIYSNEMGRFDFGYGHPFKPDRGIMTYELCGRYGLLNHSWMETLKPGLAGEQIITNFHTKDYLRALIEAGRGKASLEMLGYGLGTEDNPILHGIYEWAAMTVGGTILGMEKILNGDLDYAFNLFGGFHHAAADHAEGFCYLNDIVVAIRAALQKDEHLRIAYVDCDAHHGNGVQDAFYDDPRVLVISLHETGREIYPWSGMETETGQGEGKGYNVNIPLEPGTDDEVYGFAFDSLVVPLLESFHPRVLVAQIGADTLISDPLTHLKLTNNGYRRNVHRLRKLCPRILALAGGGYDLFRTARAWTLAWATLNQLEPEDELAGLVGGMMYGPEMEMGSLYDHPWITEGEPKIKAQQEAERVVSFLRREVFPLHGL